MKLRGFMSTIYREKSQSTRELAKAMCKASLKFEPIVADMEAIDEFGEFYRYASLASIKKATGRPLAAEGVWVHSEYGYADGVRYCCVTIEKDDEFVTSVLDLPMTATMRERKAAMTQLRRAAIEGLLDLSVEADNDARDIADEQPDKSEVNEEWEKNFSLAQRKIENATDPDQLLAVVARVEERIEEGSMAADCLEPIKSLCEERKKTLTMEAAK